jgi:hypothetical protein
MGKSQTDSEPTEDVQDDSALILWLAVLMGIYTITLSWWWLIRKPPVVANNKKSTIQTNKPIPTNNNNTSGNKNKSSKKKGQNNNNNKTNNIQQRKPESAAAAAATTNTIIAPPADATSTTNQPPTNATTTTNTSTSPPPINKNKRIMILSILWIVTIILTTYASRVLQQSTFNPYTILGVSTSASIAEIKKTYRKLSLEYHPDRWAQKPMSEQLEAKRIFQRIAKAYNTLTDETAMENWVTYGHPDGPRSFRWTTGVPSLVRENGRIFTVIYTIIGLGLTLWLFSFLRKMGADFEETNIKSDNDNDDDDDE